LRKLHNEERHNVYSSPIIIRIKKDKISRSCRTIGGEEEGI
jgi:hypothetical protein